jgi:hypothetical protein
MEVRLVAVERHPGHDRGSAPGEDGRGLLHRYQAWLADVLARINDHQISSLAALLPWRWPAEMERRKLAA